MTTTARRSDIENETGDRPDVPIRLDLERIPTLMRAMNQLDAAATKELDRVGVDAKLRELVRVRASQLNGCAYCIDLHSTDARAVGETEQRLYALPAWRESVFFTRRERAALAFTETVTLLAQTHVPAADYRAVAEHFSPDEVAALLGLITAINAWNTLAVTSRAWTPEAR